jgi:hypothetical protein
VSKNLCVEMPEVVGVDNFHNALLRSDGSEAWCSGLTCLPVTQETAGSNPVASALATREPVLHGAGFLVVAADFFTFRSQGFAVSG